MNRGALAPAGGLDHLASLPPAPPVTVIQVALLGNSGGTEAPWSLGDVPTGHVGLAVRTVCSGVASDIRVVLVDGVASVPANVAALISEGAPVVAFTCEVLQFWWRRLGWPEPRRWVDLTVCLRLCARGEDPLLALLGDGLLTQEAVRRLREDSLAIDPSEAGTAKVIFHQRAVKSLRLMDAVIGRFGMELGREEPIWAAHQAINQAGVPVDVELAKAADAMLTALTEPVLMAATTGRARMTERDLRDPKKVCATLGRLGVVVEDAKIETIEGMLSDPDALSLDPDLKMAAVTVIAARLMTAREGSFGHFAALLKDVSSDGWLRGGYEMAGHRLRRWTSRRGRLHGMRKSELTVEVLLRVMDCVLRGDLPGLLALFAASSMPMVDAALAVAGLIRLCFVAPEGQIWAVADISSFEPCGLLWLAGHDDLAAKLCGGRSEYLNSLADSVPPALVRSIPTTGQKADDWYQLAKVAFLGPMFGSGGEAVEKVARQRDVRLSSYGIDGTMLVKGFRQRWPMIETFWSALSNAAVSALEGDGDPTAGRVRYVMEGKDLIAVLPSGGRVVYPHARKVMGSFRNGWDVSYWAIEDGKPVEKSAWGGTLCQHVVTSFCRDHFAAALTRVSSTLSPRLLHTHDEIAVLVAAADGALALQHLKVEITRPETWATGLNLAAKGYLTQRYGKEFM